MTDKLKTLLRGVVDPRRDIDVPALSDRVKEMFARKEYTHLEMGAALCVWEHLNEITLINRDGDADWIALREGVGSVEMRHQSIVLGKWCLKIYDICTAHDRDFFDGLAYDWEVIPLMLRYAEKDGKPCIYEDGLSAPEQIAPLVARQVLLDEFRRQCRDEAQKQWSYAELIDDHPPDIERAFELGEEPKAFIKRLGEKLDLIDFGPWK